MLTTEWILGSAFVQWGLIGTAAVSFLSLFAIASLGSTTIDRFADNQARRILANSATPLAAQLLNRFVDLIFAAIALRILGVEGNGQYAIATVTWLYLKTISDFGLSILVAREVAKHPESAGRLIGTTTLFRLFVLALLLPILILFIALGSYWLNLSHPSVLAILLLTFSIIPASYAEAINSVFTGVERLHLPAILTVFTNLIRFSMGLLALGQGFGVPGIAGAAVLAALCNAAALHIAVQRQNVRILWEFSVTEASSYSNRLAALAQRVAYHGFLSD